MVSGAPADRAVRANLAVAVVDVGEEVEQQLSFTRATSPISTSTHSSSISLSHFSSTGQAGSHRAGKPKLILREWVSSAGARTLLSMTTMTGSSLSG